MTHLVDSMFTGPAIHANGDRKHARPRYVEWERDHPTYIHRVAWFTDSSVPLVRHSNVQTSIVLLLEPPQLHPENYDNVRVALSRKTVDVVVTHHPDAFGGEVVKPYFFGGTRIHESDWGIRQKSFDYAVSMVASDKNTLPGHRIRHVYLDTHPPGVSVFGTIQGGSYLLRKIRALEQFPYSIAIENVNTGLWFTEAILDCFLTGTIPIWWGNPSALISAGFHTDGVIFVDRVSDIEFHVKRLSDPSVAREDYNLRRPYVEHNFIQAHNYTCTEDWLARTYPELFDLLAVEALK